MIEKGSDGVFCLAIPLSQDCIIVYILFEFGVDNREYGEQENLVVLVTTRNHLIFMISHHGRGTSRCLISPYRTRVSRNLVGGYLCETLNRKKV